MPWLYLRPEHVSGGERYNFPLIAQLHLEESRTRSVPAPTTSLSRSAHASLDFLNPAHRSTPLIWLFDPLLSRSTPQRGRILGGIKAPDLPTNRGPPTTPADFFLYLSHAWFLIPYRPTINNMIILSKAFSYKIRKCILFYRLPPMDLTPGPRPPSN